MSNNLNRALLPEVMSTRDLALGLQFSVRRVRALLCAGVLPGRKVGRRWFVTRDVLLRALSPDNVRGRLSIVEGRSNA